MEKITFKKIPNDWDIPFHLLLLADPSRKLVEEYIKTWDIRGAYLDKEIVGVYVLIKKGTNTLEIINIAVDEKFQGKGIWTMMIMNIIQQARSQWLEKLEIWTWNSSIAQLALYQKCWFKIKNIDKGFFLRHYDTPIIENGIPCTDMIHLEMEII